MATDQILDERMHQTFIDGIAEGWASRSGGHVGVEASESRDGGQLYPDVSIGPPSLEDITTSRPFKRSRDFPVAQRHLNLLATGAKVERTITTFLTTGDYVRTGESIKWEATLLTVRFPDNNADANARSRIEMVWKARRVTL